MRHWLKACRIKSGVTQQQLADCVGLDVTSVNKYELGKRCPRVDTAKRIAAVLCFDWQAFYEDYNADCGEEEEETDENRAL